MNNCSDEFVVRTKRLLCARFSTFWWSVCFCHPAKMDELDEFYFLECPLLKLLLLNGGKTEHVNELFSRRDDKGEFEMLFQELWDQPEKFFEYFRMKPETFEYILEKIEESITKFSNFRKCISAKQRLAVTIR